MSENNNGAPQDESPEELKSKIAKLESDKNALVGETTDLRKSRQEKDDEITKLKEALTAATERNNANPEEAKIADIVSRVLSEKEGNRAVDNKKAAFEKFVNTNKDFHPENDPTGLKRQALEKEFNTFNTNGIVEVEDFVKLIDKAHTYLRGTGTPPQNNGTTPHSSTPPSVTPPKSSEHDNDLSPQEKILIDRNGWTKEKFLGLKAKMPDYIESLVVQVR